MEYYKQQLVTGALNAWHIVAEHALSTRLRPRDALIELGCGSGAFLAQLRDRYRVCPIAYDLSEANIANARSLGLEAYIQDFSAPRWDVNDAAFDVALSCEVLEHLVDPAHFLREVARVLRPGGWFCVTTPNAFNVVRRARFMLGDHHDPLMDPSRVPFAEHIRAFSFDMVDRMLAASGFEQRLHFGDRVPVSDVPGMRTLRSLFSSNICILAQKTV